MKLVKYFNTFPNWITIIVLLYECLVVDSKNIVTAIIERKKNDISIRLQRATPETLFNQFSKNITGEITNLDLEGTQKNAKDNEYFGLTFDYRDEIFYVIHKIKNSQQSDILGFYASGRNEDPMILYSGLSGTVRYLAFDWVNKVLYWAAPSRQVIMRTSVEPKCLAQDSSTAIIKNLNKPIGIAVHPKRRYLFWTDAGSRPGIGRSNLKGKNLLKIVGSVTNPSAISIDYDNERLYWIENRGYDCSIQSCDLNGRGQKRLTYIEESQLFDLDILKNYIIATETQHNRVYLYNIKPGYPEGKLVYKDWSGQPYGVKVFTKQKQVYMDEKRNNITDHKFVMERGTIYLGSSYGIYRMERTNKLYLQSKEKIRLFFPKDMSTAITSDAHTNFLYFYENELKTIQRINIKWTKQRLDVNWTKSELVTLAVGQVKGMAIDWISKNLYWSDSRLKQIMVSRDDGQYVHALITYNIKKPRSLVVHPTKRFLFWCNVDQESPKIERSYLDGSGRRDIVTGNKARNPRGLAIDFQNDRLYWTDGILIHYGKMDGSGQFCLHSSGHSTVKSLIVINDFIMWCDVIGKLYTAHKDNSQTQEVGDQIDRSFFDLVYHDTSTQPIAANPCSIRNGGCEQLCLPTETGHRCVCSVGYWNYSGQCISGVGDERFLLFADQRQGGLYQRPLFIDECYAIPLQLVKQPRDIVYDIENKMVYWSDIEQETISRATLNGSNQNIIFHKPNIKPYTLALDAKSQLLYFVDISRNIVIVVYLKTRQYSIIIENRLLRIRDIALDPTRGMLYISCQHQQLSGNRTYYYGAIYSATMSGKNLRLFDDSSDEPKGITVYDDEVIWIDAKRRSIEGKSVVNGTKYTLKGIEGLHELHDLAISDGYIYWTILSGKPIQRSPLNNLTETETLGRDKFYRVQGIDAYTGQILNETGCSVKDDVCSPPYICVPSPGGFDCVCPGQFTTRGECIQNSNTISNNVTCKTSSINNGVLVNIEPESYVPSGYRLEIRCNVGYKVYWKRTKTNNRYGFAVCKGGSFNLGEPCVSALHYTISYVNSHSLSGGYVILHESTPFLIPPNITRINVICIGGGGGGFDSNSKEFQNVKMAGDGQGSSFGDELLALGGEGGTLMAGGWGGIGTVYFGGDGADANSCHYGGAAGQLTVKRRCYQPSATCPFCGAGGRKSYCPLCPGGVTGGCSGPLAPKNNGSSKVLYGGGSSGGSGGGGGGGGYSRSYVDVTPGHLVPVKVGKGGQPSYKAPGDGLVVITWGGVIEQFLKHKFMHSETSYCF